MDGLKDWEAKRNVAYQTVLGSRNKVYKNMKLNIGTSYTDWLVHPLFNDALSVTVLIQSRMSVDDVDVR
jgi:hypothetical protein